MLHLTKEILQTHDGISEKFLKMISQVKSTNIDVVFDQYFTTSINYCEWSESTSKFQSDLFELDHIIS